MFAFFCPLSIRLFVGPSKPSEKFVSTSLSVACSGLIQRFASKLFTLAFGIFHRLPFLDIRNLSLWVLLDDDVTDNVSGSRWATSLFVHTNDCIRQRPTERLHALRIQVYICSHQTEFRLHDSALLQLHELIESFFRFPAGVASSGTDLPQKIHCFQTLFSLRFFSTLSISLVVFSRLRLFFRTQNMQISAPAVIFVAPRFRIAATTWRSPAVVRLRIYCRIDVIFGTTKYTIHRTYLVADSGPLCSTDCVNFVNIAFKIRKNAPPCQLALRQKPEVQSKQGS